MECECRCSDGEDSTMVKVIAMVHLQHFLSRIYTKFQRNKIKPPTELDNLGMDGCNVSLNVPRGLNAAVDGAANGDMRRGRLLEPFVDCDIHFLDATRNMEDIVLGTMHRNGYGKRKTEREDKVRDKEHQPIVG